MLPEAVTPFLSQHAVPFALALSGGGDSMALLHALRKAPRLVCALIVDHGLRPESKQEAEITKRRAESWGVDAHILSWSPGSIQAGLQEKAREARYGLMGDFCRRRHILRLLTAHHQGDQVETLVMRYDKGTDWRGAAGMSASRYAPIWPALADVTLCRPLLGVPKRDILAYLNYSGVSWIEDPSNANRDFTRVRIRQKLAQEPRYIQPLLETARALSQAKAEERLILAKQVTEILTLSPQGYARLSALPYTELLTKLLRIISGTGGPIVRSQVLRARADMQGKDFKALTLAGTHISKTTNGFLMCRDAVAVKGRKNKQQMLHKEQAIMPDEPYIWDGRFIACSTGDGVTAEPIFGQMSQLPKRISSCVKEHPREVRLTLPLWRRNGHVIGAGAGMFEGLEVRATAQTRLKEALGKLSLHE